MLDTKYIFHILVTIGCSSNWPTWRARATTSFFLVPDVVLLAFAFAVVFPKAVTNFLGTHFWSSLFHRRVGGHSFGTAELVFDLQSSSVQTLGLFAQAFLLSSQMKPSKQTCLFSPFTLVKDSLLPDTRMRNFTQLLPNSSWPAI